MTDSPNTHSLAGGISAEEEAAGVVESGRGSVTIVFLRRGQWGRQDLWVNCWEGQAGEDAELLAGCAHRFLEPSAWLLTGEEGDAEGSRLSIYSFLTALKLSRFPHARCEKHRLNNPPGRKKKKKKKRWKLRKTG